MQHSEHHTQKKPTTKRISLYDVRIENEHFSSCSIRNDELNDQNIHELELHKIMNKKNIYV